MVQPVCEIRSHSAPGSVQEMWMEDAAEKVRGLKN